MSDYESDLTDFEDEDEVPLSQVQTNKKLDEYRIRGALNAPRATSYTTQALHEMLEQGDIDLDADYQRGIVWPAVKQTGLIDSIFRNFYVPPVIFAVTYSTDGTERRICIDGKQRLTSIWKFMEGAIPFRDSITGDKFYYRDNFERVEKSKFKMLPDRYKKVFKTKQIVCVEYTELTPDNEREIFQRVQLGMALTPAERLQAIYGPTSDFIRGQLLNEYVHNELESSLQWDTGRANDFRCVATVVHCMEKMPGSIPGVDTLSKWLEYKKSLDESFQEDVHSTFKIFTAMARSSEYGSCFRMEDNIKTGRDGKTKMLKVSPIEFITSALLIHQHKRKLTLSQLTEAIRKMRTDVRTKEQDIRTNTRVSRLMFAFIKELKVSQLKSDNGKPAAVTGVELYARGPTKKEDSQVSSKKRLRFDDSDDEYVEQHKPGPPTSKRTTRAKSARSPSPKPLSPVVKAPPSPETAPAKAPPPAQTTAHRQTLSQVNQPSLQSPIVPVPPPHVPSQPPPVSEQMRSAGPRMHPDRLAAIRVARSSDSPRMPRADMPLSPAISNHSPSDGGWGSVGMRMGSGPLASHPSSTQLPLPYDNLSQSLMSRMQMSYTPGPTHRVDYRELPPTSEPYDPRQPNGHPPYPRRDSYPKSGSGGQRGTQRQW